jgi:hypothetical protein
MVVLCGRIHVGEGKLAGVHIVEGRVMEWAGAGTIDLSACTNHLDDAAVSTSTMAPSTTRPRPLVRASSRAQAIPNARPSAPLASPTTVGGTIGRSPRYADSDSSPVNAT